MTKATIYLSVLPGSQLIMLTMSVWCWLYHDTWGNWGRDIMESSQRCAAIDSETRVWGSRIPCLHSTPSFTTCPHLLIEIYTPQFINQNSSSFTLIDPSRFIPYISGLHTDHRLWTKWNWLLTHTTWTFSTSQLYSWYFFNVKCNHLLRAEGELKPLKNT